MNVTPDKRPVLVIAGPTASGKSSAGVALSRYLRMEIISADARQVYKGLDIGTASPTKDDLAAVPHHLVNILDVDEKYSASAFADDVAECLPLIPDDSLPVFVGGSGMYLRAAIDGLSEHVIEADENIRAELREELNRDGRDAMYNRLQAVDPVAAEKYDDRNPRRVLRALEFYHQTGSPFSSTWQSKHRVLDVAPTFVALQWDREALYERINARCDAMWTGGLFDETKATLDAGIDRYAQSLRTVGYKEACSVILDNEDEAQALETFKMTSRRYAKRQMTWFRADDRYSWVEGNVDPELVAKTILERVRSVPSMARFVL